jgi:hypothetical protein
VRALRPEVPAEVEAVIRCLMAKEREHRFQQPAELAQELGALLGGGGGASQPPASRGALPPGGARGGPGVGGGAGALGEPAALRSTDSQAVTTVSATPLGDAAFLEKFRQWTVIVEFTLRRRGALRGINRPAFRALHQELVVACQAEANAGEGERRAFYLRLEERLKPWLSPEALAQAELEIHCQVASEFQEAAQELERLLAGSGAAETKHESGLGRLLSGFKRRRDQHNFKAYMRQQFGVDL